MAKKKKQLIKKIAGVPVRTQLLIVTGAVLLLVLFGTFVAWLDKQVGYDLLPVRKEAISSSFKDVIIRGELVNGLNDTGLNFIKTSKDNTYQIIGLPTKVDNKTYEAKGKLSSPSKENPYNVTGVLKVQ